MKDYEYVVTYYGVPACTGRRVLAYGKPGVIAESMGHRIGILLDCDKPGNVKPYHPVDGIEYLPEIVNVRQGDKRMEFRLEKIDGERFVATSALRMDVPESITDEEVLCFLGFLNNLWEGDQSGGECVGILKPETLCGKPVEIVNRDTQKTDDPPMSLLDALRMLNEYWEGK